jgi:DNA-binding beta-propeller fold protein YncE
MSRASRPSVFLLAAVSLVVVVGAAAAASRQQPARLPLAQVTDLPLDGGSSRFDYLSLDPRRHTLYLAHLGASSVSAIDLRKPSLLGSVGGVPSAHGVLVVPELGRVFATATGTNQLVTIDEATRKIVARTPTGAFPDGVAYDPGTKRVFVSDLAGGDETVIDARTSKRLGSIRLGGDVGNVQYDEVAHMMLAAVGSTDELVTLDPRRLRVVARTQLPGCQGAHGVNVDSTQRLAFVACEDNERLVVVDVGQRKAIGSQSVGTTPDVLAFDPGLRRLYVAAESGIVAVFVEQRHGLTKLAEAFLAPDAHAVAVDPATHLVYFPLENVHGRALLRVMRPTPRA